MESAKPDTKRLLWPILAYQYSVVVQIRGSAVGCMLHILHVAGERIDVIKLNRFKFEYYTRPDNATKIVNYNLLAIDEYRLALHSYHSKSQLAPALPSYNYAAFGVSGLAPFSHCDWLKVQFIRFLDMKQFGSNSISPRICPRGMSISDRKTRNRGCSESSEPLTTDVTYQVTESSGLTCRSRHGAAKQRKCLRQQSISRSNIRIHILLLRPKDVPERSKRRICSAGTRREPAVDREPAATIRADDRGTLTRNDDVHGDGLTLRANQSC
ncbi:hypothetical protein EVAR_8644_1 [Eumeta japonica]|uniref:Uncharacterized protein n=1 Tax=Eumeta variegata TaxID=151549 RepID=A0A4C1TUG4_EUMVA|nr:hypothetical protein EVAR_8644_1 [Eumeta japonica]